MNYFLITTRGLTASTWLSKTLDCLPNVLVSHGRDFPERSQEDIVNLLNDESYRNSRIDFEISTQRKVGIVEFLTNKIPKEKLKNYKCIGNVHGYKLEEAISKCNNPKGINADLIANLIRGPFPFICSYMNMVYQNYMVYPEKYFAEHLPRIEQNKKYLSFFKYEDISIINTIFIEACFACLASAKDLNISKCDHITMESLTQNKNSLKSLLKLICEKYNLDSSNLEKIVKNNQIIKNVNTHKNAPKIFSYKSIEENFNIDLKKFNHWPEIWKDFCVEFFDQDFLNYNKYYSKDPILDHFNSHK